MKEETHLGLFRDGTLEADETVFITRENQAESVAYVIALMGIASKYIYF